MGPLTALLIELLSNWLISAKPNNADALRRYFIAKDRLDDLIARNANTASIMAQSEIVAKLKRVLNLDELGNPIGPCHTLFLIDEFPILPKINALLIGPEVGRGMKVSYYLICQNFPQIAEKYGQDAVNRMISNSYALVVLPVSDISTAERIAKLAGHTTSIKESYSRSTDFKSWMNGGNKSLSAEKISLIEPTHLRSMSGTYGADRYILFIRDRHDHPAIVDSAKWFADPRLKTLVNPSVMEHNRGLPEEEWTGGYRETTAMPIHAMAMHKIRMGLYDRKYFTAEEMPTLPPFALGLIESREAHNRRLAEGAAVAQAA